MRKAGILLLWGALLVAPAKEDPRQASVALAKESRHWRCDVTLKAACEPPGGCRPLEAQGWILLDFGLKLYQRCDQLGCDKYPMVAREAPGGVFTYIQLVDRYDVFMKIGLANMFVDIATVGISPVNSFGVCRPNR